MPKNCSKNYTFRYRGYYYDTDLGLYYLGSRYYDTNTGRFINADSSLYHGLTGYNMFIYCNNNPVNYFDPTGEWATQILIVGWCTAFAEPTPIGEIAMAVVTLALFGVVIIENLILEETPGDLFSNVLEAESKADTKEEEPPKSVDEPDDSKDTKTDNKSQNSLPITGEPNSDKHLYDEKGLKQTRHYGPDGKAEYDIDYRHSGEKHNFPHKHVWDWSKNPPRSSPIDIY